jgi:hypothetical protein
MTTARIRRADPRWRYVAAGAAIMALAAAVLLAMGRTPFCRCGSIKLWTPDAWGPENSQQLTDPYSFTHITHGILLYWITRAVAPRLALPARALLSLRNRKFRVRPLMFPMRPRNPIRLSRLQRSKPQVPLAAVRGWG